MNAANTLWLAFFALCALGTIASLLVADEHAPRVVAWAGGLAAALLLAAGVVAASGIGDAAAASWRWPLLGTLRVRIDPMSSLFLIATGAVALPVAIFSQGYLASYRGRYALGPFGALYHLLLASIAMVLIADDLLTFVIGWEAMSVLSYLLVSFEHRREQCTRAGVQMLAMGEVGTLAAVIALLALAARGGGLDFALLRSGARALGPAAHWMVLLACFFGFGVKAGLVPVNSWLPRAHPAAPANVSALLSGVILNLGLYGIFRVTLDLLPAVSVGEGLVVLGVGSLSALVGILYATTDDDMKSMLAHSSIENIGVITAALGAGLVFAAAGHPTLAAFACVAAVYHLLNHSLYKALLFLGAGSVDAAAGERDMNRLGGLMRRMPWTAATFLVGALAIAALPPLNGFVSEWLTLQAFLRSAELGSPAVRVVFVLAGAALALTAALAVTCFVKAFAMSFLGRPRSDAAAASKPAPRSMRLAMVLLALGCVSLGVLPTYVIPRLDAAINAPADRYATEALVPAFFQPATAKPPMAPAFVAEFHELGAQVGGGVLPGRGLVVLHRGRPARNPVVFAMSTSYMVLALALLLGGAAVVFRTWRRAHRTDRRRVWAGGLRELRREMSYTATGFSNPVRVVFNAVFRPSADETRAELVAGHFRSAITRHRDAPHLVERWLVGPVVRALQRMSAAAARMHAGRINAYAGYMLLALVAVLVLAAVR